jgi:hypothetical protein
MRAVSIVVEEVPSDANDDSRANPGQDVRNPNDELGSASGEVCSSHCACGKLSNKVSKRLGIKCDVAGEE